MSLRQLCRDKNFSLTLALSPLRGEGWVGERPSYAG